MATFSQRIIATALPRGWFPQNPNDVVPPAVHVVAFIAPQLSTGGDDAHLVDFPDFRHWPTTLEGLTWRVTINGVEMNAAVVTDPDVRLDAWDGAFSDETLVHSFTPAPPSFGQAQVLSAPVDQLVGYVRNLYTTVLTNGGATELPAVQMLGDLVGPVSFYGRDGKKRKERIQAALGDVLVANRYVPAGFTAPGFGAAATAFVQHEAFLSGFTDNSSTPTKAITPTRDFHEYVSVLGHYRQLIRLLGLAVDLRVVLPPDFETPPDPCDVQLVVDGTFQIPATTLITPITKTAFTRQLFLAHQRPTAPLLFLGRLALADTDRYEAVQLDHDGATIKLRQFAENLDREQDHHTSNTPARQALPSLRSGGLSVAMVGQPGNADKVPMAGEVVTEIDAGLDSSDAIQSNGTPVFWAEDLNRGFRFDVWDDLTRRWHSLSARTGSFSFPSADGTVRVPFTDAAISQLTPTSATSPPANQPMHLHQQQTMFHWTGWSLGAHRPGRTLAPHYGPGDDTLTDQMASPPADFPLGFAGPLGGDGNPSGPLPIAVPGSLPRLRFGHTYHVRARGADVAGDSVDFDDPTIGPDDPRFGAFFATQAVFYGRFEPVQSPPLAFRSTENETSAGESLERLVIRSNYVPAAGDTQWSPPNPATPMDERHVMPPAVSVLMIEQHGLLDVGGPVPIDPTTYAMLAARDTNPLPGQPGVGEANRRGQAVDVPNVTVDWLPDPFARGATFLGLPGADGAVFVNFDQPANGHRWPDPVPWRLSLTEGTGAPVPFNDDGDRYLEVFLDKADIAQVRVSCHLFGDPNNPVDPGDPAFFKLWDWLTIDQKKQLLPFILGGVVWMFTPFRTITLVHAVRQPLATAEFTDLSVRRSIGQTFATLVDRVAFSRKSTGRVDFHASWPAPVDDGPRAARPTQFGDFAPGAPTPVPRAGAKLDIPLHGGTSPTVLELNYDHEFGDTKRKIVVYEPEATTKFVEYFTEHTTLTVTGYGPASAVLLSTHGIAPAVSVRQVTTDFPPTDGQSYSGSGKVPAWTIDTAAGTIWFNKYTALPAGTPNPTVPLLTQVDVKFVALPISRFSKVPVERDIPASARPVAPHVTLLTPAFGWTASGDAHTVSSARQGGILRVYMQRPWWTSGVGERLGVLLFRGGEGGSDTPIPDQLQPYVSQWGSDPAYAGFPLPTPYPTLATFPEATVKDGLGRHLDELPHVGGLTDSLVDVAAHDVFFDAEQDLWYSDIRMAAGSAYMPFVRLALARYQPNAVDRFADNGSFIDDVHLSRVVLADFAQLAPDRSVTVTFRPNQQILSVSLFGPTYDATAAGPGPGTAYVTVQMKDTSVRNELGWNTMDYRLPMAVRSGVGSDKFWTRENIVLKLPRNQAQFRLLIEQFDTFHYEGGSTTPPNNGAQTLIKSGKLVHSDVIVI